MARISGINLPTNKKISIALSYIYGIGRSLANKTLKEAQISPNLKVSDLGDDQISKIQHIIDQKFKTEGALRQEIRDSIKRLKIIKSYRGSRHEKRLPSRGQKTRTNSRTIRGNVRVTAAGTTYRRSQPSPT